MMQSTSTISSFRMTPAGTAAGLFLPILMALCCCSRIPVTAFVLLPLPSISSSPSSSCSTTTTASTSTTSSTQLGVFDFFKQRTSEGFQQLNNLADATYKGQLGRGLAEVAVYTSETNRATFQGLAKSRARLLQNLESLFSTGMFLNNGNLQDLLEELEDILLQADLGAQTTEDILKEVASLRDAASTSTPFSRDDLRSILRGKLVEALQVERLPSAIQFSTDPNVPTILFIMGANGMGKTTTIGKLAHRLKEEANQTVLIAACDTFRAGAVEQLQTWAERAQVDWVGPCDKAKTPAAVLYKALDTAMLTMSTPSTTESTTTESSTTESSTTESTESESTTESSTESSPLKRKYDTVLVDTSGRLSSNDALTQELAKMKRVIQKRLSVANDAATDADGDANGNGKPIPNLHVPHETLLVLDAAQGRMALDSARVWNREIGLTGLVLTKLDGSARGGSVVAVSRDLQLPVKLIGVGEGIDDLRDFVPEMFVDGLLGIGSAADSSSSTTAQKRKQSPFGVGVNSNNNNNINEEGKMLAERLAAMRRERDARAKERATTAAATTTTAAVAGSSGTMATAAVAETATLAPQPKQPSRSNRLKSNSSNSNKAKKKKSRK